MIARQVRFIAQCLAYGTPVHTNQLALNYITSRAVNTFDFGWHHGIEFVFSDRSRWRVDYGVDEVLEAGQVR